VHEVERRTTQLLQLLKLAKTIPFTQWQNRRKDKVYNIETRVAQEEEKIEVSAERGDQDVVVVMVMTVGQSLRDGRRYV
jgi:hypothetical protein